MKIQTLLLALTLVATIFLGGCALGPIPGQSRQEVSNEQRVAFEEELKMFVDDWNYFWLIDRPTRLSRYNVYVGD
jgi:hypothetical protein